MIVSTLHKVGSGILCIFLPDFQVGGRSRYNPDSEIPDNKSFSHLPQHFFPQRWFTFTGERRGSLTPIFKFNALCAI